MRNDVGMVSQTGRRWKYCEDIVGRKWGVAMTGDGKFHFLGKRFRSIADVDFLFDANFIDSAI